MVQPTVYQKLHVNELEDSYEKPAAARAPREPARASLARMAKGSALGLTVTYPGRTVKQVSSPATRELELRQLITTSKGPTSNRGSGTYRVGHFHRIRTCTPGQGIDCRQQGVDYSTFVERRLRAGSDPSPVSVEPIDEAIISPGTHSSVGKGSKAPACPETSALPEGRAPFKDRPVRRPATKTITRPEVSSLRDFARISLVSIRHPIS